MTIFAKIRAFVASFLVELAIRLTSLNLLLASHEKTRPFQPAQCPCRVPPPFNSSNKTLAIKCAVVDTVLGRGV